jgi:FkbM family methyltransferase
MRRRTGRLMYGRVRNFLRSSHVARRAAALGLDPRRVLRGRTVWASPSSGMRFALSYDVDQLVTRVVRNEHIFEPQITRFLIANVSPGDVAVDVGANVGYYTLLLALLVGPGGTVYAFEPLFPAALRRNLALNERYGGYFAQVRVVDCALTDRLGTVRMYRPRRQHFAYASLSHVSDSEVALEVPGSMLDEMLADEAQVDWLKLDVEGAEALVLRGGMELLQRTKPHIVMEWSGPALERLGVPEVELAAFLRSYGYALYSSAAAMGPLELPTPFSSAHTIFATARPNALKAPFRW